MFEPLSKACMLAGFITVTLGGDFYGDLCLVGDLNEFLGGEDDFILLIFFTTLCSLVAS